jgi:hypothetical protein
MREGKKFSGRLGEDTGGEFAITPSVGISVARSSNKDAPSVWHSPQFDGTRSQTKEKRYLSQIKSIGMSDQRLMYGISPISV